MTGIFKSVAGLCLLAGSLSAAPSFARIFTNDAVLQRDKPVHIWGLSAANETVTVTFNSQSVSATANAGGRWSLYLPAMTANGTGQTLAVSALSGSASRNNVVLGDVWLASGQSNMEFPLSNAWYNKIPQDTTYYSWPDIAQPNGVTDATQTDLPNLRFFYLPSWPGFAAATPQEDYAAAAGLAWGRCVPTNGNMKYYSALAFYVARHLHLTHGVPIGVIQAAVGGTPAESYTSLEALQAEPALAGAVPTGAPTGASDNQWPTGLFNGEINPITGMTLKGILWNQGESNLGTSHGITPQAYETLFTAMIKDWRHRFGENLPFLFVQLPNISMLVDATTNQSWADNCNAYYASAGTMGDVRWAQYKALALTNTGMSVGFDHNPNAQYWDANTARKDSYLWHPPNKEAHATRLTPWAEALAYGGSLPVAGPLFVSSSNFGNAIQMTFDRPLSTNDGLAARGFTLGNAAGTTWVWAENVLLAGNSAVVSAPTGMPSPAQCRYAWAINPMDTLCSPTRSPNLSDLSGVYLAAPAKTYSQAGIQVLGNGIPIADQDMAPTVADGRDFGSVDMVNFVDHSFSIQSVGSVALQLSGGPAYVRLYGAHAADFSLLSQPAGSVGAGTSFNIRFQPSGLGRRTAYALITSNDPNHTPYYLYLQGDGFSSITPSPTPNWTHTVSPTITPTFSASPTVAVPCEDWNFDDGGVQGWQVNQGPATGLAASTTESHDAAYSLKADLALAQGGGNNQVILAAFNGFPRDYTGRTIHAWVYVPAGMSDAVNPSAAMLVLMTGGAYHWNASPWNNLPATAGWIELTLDVSGMTYPGEINDVRGLAVQFALGGTSPAWSGTVYLDSLGRTTGVCAGPTPTPSFSVTPVFSPTPTPTPSPSFSPSPVLSPTPTPTPSPSATVTVSPSASPTPTPSRTAGPVTGVDGNVVEARPLSNPQRGAALRLAFRGDGRVEAVEVVLYSSAYTQVLLQRVEGPFGPGWNRLSVPMDAALNPGVYFYRLQGQNRGGPAGDPISGRLYRLP